MEDMELNEEQLEIIAGGWYSAKSNIQNTINNCNPLENIEID